MPNLKTNKSIVINTSPWIALSLCKQTSIIKKLYNNVFIPETVRNEILAGGNKGIGVHELHKADWLNVEKVKDIQKINLLYELEKGEAEVIVLAIEKGINQVLIDEKIARQQAKILNLNVIGTLGLLLKAKNKGLIKELKPLIKSIVDGGYWIKDNIIEAILKEAGE